MRACGCVRMWGFVLAALLAGCISDASDDGAASALPSILYLAADHTLVEHAPPDGNVPIGSFFRAWAEGGEQPTWRGAPVGGSTVVTSARLDFSYTTDGAVATTGPAGQPFPEFVVYFGTESAPMGWASIEAEELTTQDQVVEVSAELDLPVGGLVLPAGVSPIVKIAAVQTQGDDGPRVIVLVGGAEPESFVALEHAPARLPPSVPVRVVDEQGTLVGSAYALGEAEGLSASSFPVEMPVDAVGLVGRMERTSGAGVQDIDLEVLGPDGAIVARSVTPEPNEGVALYAPNVEAVGDGTWTVRVVNYGNLAADFALTVDVLHRAG